MILDFFIAFTIKLVNNKVEGNMEVPLGQNHGNSWKQQCGNGEAGQKKSMQKYKLLTGCKSSTISPLSLFPLSNPFFLLYIHCPSCMMA